MLDLNPAILTKKNPLHYQDITYMIGFANTGVKLCGILYIDVLMDMKQKRVN